MGYRVVKKLWQYVQPFWYSTSVWQTDARKNYSSAAAVDVYCILGVSQLRFGVSCCKPSRRRLCLSLGNPVSKGIKLCGSRLPPRFITPGQDISSQRPLRPIFSFICRFYRYLFIYLSVRIWLVYLAKSLLHYSLVIAENITRSQTSLQEARKTVRRNGMFSLQRRRRANGCAIIDCY